MSETGQGKGNGGEGESKGGEVLEMPARGDWFGKWNRPVEERIEGVDMLGQGSNVEGC